MDENLQVMGWYGIKIVISNWKQYAIWDIVQVDDNSLIVKGIGTITLRIGRETIGTLCPQILNDEQLMQRLIGQEIVLFHNFFILALDMVTQIDTELNMTVGLTTLLGNMSDVINVMDGVQLKDGATLTFWIPPSHSLRAPELVYR
ncbi:hypothetical protein THRCLA_21994 [Thraustotheca clavata]|uniref:Uncharacterized protein n=1 Tax=Thraustotheca clavata TaxID=74557 RepID=A0A1V9ZF16_9STRA|nr:hypothetical protein THRCLA_21994 [Thraustotheca clavata]